MSRTALVRVVGFSNAERHALNSLLRISQQRSPSYDVWTPESHDLPSLLLLDEWHPDAHTLAQQHHGDHDLKILWVGDESHIFAWRNYKRPMSWVTILQGMDDAVDVKNYHLNSDFGESDTMDFDISAPDAGQFIPRGTAAADRLPTTDSSPMEMPPLFSPVRKRVLVVDDDKMSRMYLKAKLSLVEPIVDVDEASNGDEAMQMARTFSYDGVLLDVNMPGTDGYAVCRAIKRPSPNSPSANSGRIPKVFMITSRDSMVDRVRATFAGADAYMSKPPHPARLWDIISTL